jgi:hypothetical protein
MKEGEMNCDQAFDYLTDSARRESAALARHLAGCPRCRQLKDTLEPALDLFDELVPEPGIGSFDGTAPATAEDTVRTAEQSAARLSGWQSASRIRTAVRYAAVFLLGASLAFAVAVTQREISDRSAPAGSICAWKNRTEAADRDQPGATAVVLSCVGCHLKSSSQADNSSAYNFDAFRQSSSLVLLSSDLCTTFPPLESDGLLTAT